LAGCSGVRTLTRFDVSQHPSQIAAQIAEVPCPEGWEPADFGRRSKLEQILLSCCAHALRDSGWWDRRHSVRLGVVMGLGAEWLSVWDADARKGGRRLYSPQAAEEPLVQKAAKELGLTGPAISVAAACASGNYAIGQARQWLELGWVDVCLAGACDSGVSELGLAGFGNLRALSRRNAEPQAASRPFDKGRDGFVMGEGGAAFVLEKASSARRRSAHAYAEVAGCGASSDAHNMVIPSPDPEPAMAAMRRALTDAGVRAGEIDYINAHATSTPVGDIAETNVLKAVLGSDTRCTPVSSTKSMTGHCLTAAAAIEALACLIAIDRHAMPPTINLVEPDPGCDLCHVANQAREGNVRVAVSNSFGFGGSNTCLVLRVA
jgi:3-oxoacyl-[acyl-carrier-protein] synthase II